MTQQRYTEAATELTEAVRDAYQLIFERSVAAQERGARIAQTVLEHGITELRSQSAAARELAQAFSAQPGQPDSLREAYQTFMATATAAQERGIKLAQTLVESGIDEMKAQAESAQAIFQSAVEQSEKQAGALQTVARESVAALAGFAFSPFALFRDGLGVGE
jgi:hypothetical protein